MFAVPSNTNPWFSFKSSSVYFLGRNKTVKHVNTWSLFSTDEPDGSGKQNKLWRLRNEYFMYGEYIQRVMTLPPGQILNSYLMVQGETVKKMICTMCST